MSNSEKNEKKTLIAFIDYIPAELKERKDWLIEYYVKNPNTGRLKRYRNRVKPLTNVQERRKLAKKIILELNEKLKRGYNPVIENENASAFISLKEVIEKFAKKLKKDTEAGVLRKETLVNYLSYTNITLTYLIDNKLSDMFVYGFNKKFVNQLLDWVYYEKNLTVQTRNNYLTYYRVFSTYLVEQDYLKAKPTDGIKTLKKTEKKRTVIPPEVREEIFQYLFEHDKHYLLACQIEYYCMIRPHELSFLKIKDIDFERNLFFVDREISKNKKDGFVTIPETLKNFMLSLHIDKMPQEYYLFSDNFKAGHEQKNSKRFRDAWLKMREVLEFSDKYVFYSLKDTGITDLLNSGIPSLVVRNQARHHNIAVTDTYTPHLISKADNLIMNNETYF